MYETYYIETSIPSFYYDMREDAQAQVMKEWTRQWWHMPKEDAIVVTDIPVIVELSRARDPKRSNALKLIEDIPILDYAEIIDEIIAAYIGHKLMPNEAMGDASHLALASYHKCDFLVTRNCKKV